MKELWDGSIVSFEPKPTIIVQCTSKLIFIWQTKKTSAWCENYLTVLVWVLHFLYLLVKVIWIIPPFELATLNIFSHYWSSFLWTSRKLVLKREQNQVFGTLEDIVVSFDGSQSSLHKPPLSDFWNNLFLRRVYYKQYECLHCMVMFCISRCMVNWNLSATDCANASQMFSYYWYTMDITLYSYKYFT